MSEKKINTFALTSVGILKDGGILVEYTTREREGDEHIPETHTLKSKRVPHPDLVDALKKLNVYLARCYNVNAIEQLRNDSTLKATEKKAFSEIEKLLDGLLKDSLGKIEISGISLSGEEGKRGLIIKGKQKQANNSKTAINSPRIPLHQTAFGFEDDLQEIVNEIVAETKAFLFEGKKAQLEIFENNKEKPKAKRREKKEAAEAA